LKPDKSRLQKPRFSRRASHQNKVSGSLVGVIAAKTLALIRLARLEPRTVGACCPFCPFDLPTGQLLNGLIEHMAVAHLEMRLRVGDAG
jgi:hypothetical protein